MASQQRSTANGSLLPALLLAGGAVRAGLLLWGAWQDAHMAVKYTDIDYQLLTVCPVLLLVVTDGARLMAAGHSPFERSTFRYTPLLAALLLPNVVMHPAAGKLIFCGADLFAGWLLDAVLLLQGVARGGRAASVALWLFNPFTAAISSRGSGEALVTVMLLLILLLLFKGRHLWAAAVLGLVVHWRIYPVIYALPIWHFLPSAGESRSLRSALAAREAPPAAHTRQHSCKMSAAAAGVELQPNSGGREAVELSADGEGMSLPRTTLRVALNLFSRERLAFGAVAATTFACLGLGCYALYGQPFLQEAYLYHGSRRDPRHNFAPYFYPTYLELGAEHPSDALPRLGSACQLGVVALLGSCFSAHLPFAMLLQTLAFVALNKVCTAQYFVWYFSLASLVLPFIPPGRRRRLLGALLGWAAAQVHWLGWAYMLEFRGRSVFLVVWAASILFLVANVALIVQLLHSFSAPTSFRQQSMAFVARRALHVARRTQRTT